MFLDNFTKKQYKAYKNGIIVGIYNSKDMADKDLKSGYLDRYEEVPEQIQFNGKFYNKFEVPIQFYANNLKFKLLELYYHYIVTSINSIIKLIKFCILPVFLVTLFILIFYICVIGYNNIPENKSWIDYVSAIAPTIVGLGSVITAIWAIGYTKQSIKQQQEQWLKNEFIKREAQIIIDFREKFDDAKESIFWFLNTFMQPCKCNNFIPNEEQLTIKVEEFNKHYNELKELNDLYNKNQLIYRKHDIDKNMIYITALLKSITFLKGNDFTAIYNKKTENYIEYIRPECIKFTNSFLTNLDFEFAPKNKNITIYLENINKSSNSEERLKKYIEKASQEFISLSFKLDEMTTYYNGKIPNNLKIRQKYHFQSAEDFFIEKCKK